MSTTINLTSLKKINSVVLCKINKSQIGEIPTDFIDSEKRSLNEIHEIQLTIPKYITDRKTNKKKEYILYKEFKNKRFLYIDDNEYFVIENVKENKRKTEKVITAYKGEYTLSRKNITIEDSYIQLMSEDLSDINYPIYSINNELQSSTGWSFGHIDDDILYEDIMNKIEKLRKTESVDTDWYDFITGKLAELYDYVPFFDTINKKIDLVKLDNFGEEIQLCLSYDNYMNDLAIESDSKDLITRLNIINDNLDIASATPTGYNHINNFSYFMENGEMSNELISALKKYESMIEDRREQWKALIDEKLKRSTSLNLKRNEWFICNSQLNVILNQINVFRTENDAVNVALKQTEYSLKSDEEKIMRNEIKKLEDEIALLDESILNINILCRYETCTDNRGNLIFTEELLDELKEFVFEDSFKEESYLTEEDMLNASKRKLELECRPTITYDIDVANFIDRIIDNGFRQHWKGILSFGDIIVLLDDEGNEDLVYFTDYTYDYKNNSLSLTLANKKVYKDTIRTINDWRRTSNKIYKIVSQNSYVFNDTKKLRLNMDGREIK